MRWLHWLKVKAEADVRMAAALERLADQGEQQMSECGRSVAARMNEAAKIDIGSQPIETELELQQRLLVEGVELPAPCRPWGWFPLLTPERLLRAFNCGGQRDSVTWLEFCRISTQQDTAFFECDRGWLGLQNIKPGASAEVHGAAFAGRRGEDKSIDAPTAALLDYLMERFKLPVLLSFYPEHNRRAAFWDEKFGFQKMGVIPLQDFWDGKARNVIVTARFKMPAQATMTSTGLEQR